MAARHDERYNEHFFFTYFSCTWKGLSNDGVEVARSTVFQKIRPGVGFKTGGFGKEELEGLP